MMTVVKITKLKGKTDKTMLVIRRVQFVCRLDFPG